MLKRTIEPFLLKALEKKITLLSGPRQVGKTFISKNLPKITFEYLSFDSSTDRKIILSETWDRQQQLVIFDELHKMKKWKSWLKGIYDTEGIPPKILVTGSARLNTYRKGGDSLAGRHRLFRLCPLSLKEIGSSSLKTIHDIFRLGAFPEPFLNGNETNARLWRKSHLDMILREDLLDLENVRNIKSIELLTDLLAERVGSSISYKSLSEDLQVSPNTVKHWIEILQNLFVIFVVSPYSKDIAKAIVKEPKIYFYDIGRVTAPDTAKLENLVACHLLKRNLFLEDTQGYTMQLCYIRDKDKREVDFLTVREKKPELLIEVKTSEDHISKSLAYYTEKLKPNRSEQWVLNLKRKYSTAKTKVCSVGDALFNLET